MVDYFFLDGNILTCRVSLEKHARKKPTDWKMECLMIFPCHLPKAGKNQYLFTCNFNRKKIAAKTKILTKTGKINLSILF